MRLKVVSLYDRRDRALLASLAPLGTDRLSRSVWARAASERTAFLRAPPVGERGGDGEGKRIDVGHGSASGGCSLPDRAI